MANSFKKEVEKGLALISNEIGFKKRRYNFYKQINDNVFSTIGYGLATYTEKGHIFVNATIGVFFRDVEEILAKLTGFDTLRIMQPTIGIQIGYLMPEHSFKEWNFVEAHDNRLLYGDICQCIKAYGFPYQEKMKNVDNLFAAFERRDLGVSHQTRDLYLPILYYLKGDKEKGQMAIEDAIDRQKEPVDESSLLTFKGAKEVITIVGGGIGKVDPEYLKFAERYRSL